MPQWVGMGEMKRVGEMREKIYLNLPHLPHLHSRQKDQLLMTTPSLRRVPDFSRSFLLGTQHYSIAP